MEMTFDEMCSFIVDGGKATCNLFGDKTYTYYNFSGFRIGGEGGSSSNIRFTDELKAVEWREYVEPVKAWADLPTVARAVERQKSLIRNSKFGKFKEALPINDIGDWQNKPVDKSVETATVNPWLEIKPKKEGWASYD